MFRQCNVLYLLSMTPTLTSMNQNVKYLLCSIWDFFFHSFFSTQYSLFFKNKKKLKKTNQK
jgi:hypothetical protein